MVKRVTWTETARLCRQEILAYWAAKTGNKIYSRKLSKAFNERINHLKKYPDLGKNIGFEAIRTTACGHFSIFYCNEPQEIVIIGIYDTRRNPEVIVAKLKNKYSK